MSGPNLGALSPGQIFHGRYEIVRCLRAGGMGAVYECVHQATRKRRALKLMLPQILSHPGMRERFELEARVTADIESDHIVETFDAGVDEQTGAPFLVMELLRGEDLLRVLAARGALPAGEVVLLLSQAALALDKTHAAGIVHRDLKPENLFLTTRDDGSPRLKILDFGIAKVVADVNQTAQQTATIGTPLYMPAEQIRGEGTIGPRADVYALGHIAFTLLTGRAFWDEEQKASPSLFTFLGKVVDGPPEPATVRAVRRGVTLPPAFDGWFARATARAASDRFDRASTLVRELAAVLGAPAGAHDGGSARQASAPRISQVDAISGPSGTPAQTGPEGRTEGTSSKSIGSTPRRSSLPLALAVLGALGAAAVGLFVVARAFHASAATASTAETAATTAEVPRAVVTMGEAPSPPSPPATTTAVAVEAVAAGPSASAVPPPAAPSVKAAPSAKAAPGKQPSGVARPPVGGQGCDPPYVIDGAGHRHMKPQCL